MADPRQIKNIIYRAYGICNIPSKNKIIDLSRDVPLSLQLHLSEGLKQVNIVSSIGEKIQVDFENNYICYLNRPLEFKDMINNSPYSFKKPPAFYQYDDEISEIHVPSNIHIIIIKNKDTALRLNFKTQTVEKLVATENKTETAVKRSSSSDM